MPSTLWDDFEAYYQYELQNETLVNPVEYYIHQQSAGINTDRRITPLQLLERHGLTSILGSFSEASESRDSGRYTLAVKVVGKLLASSDFLQELSPDESLDTQIIGALRSGCPELTILVLKLLTRVASGQLKHPTCFSREIMFSDSLLESIFACLLSNNAAVGNMAISTLFSFGGGKVVMSTLESDVINEGDTRKRCGSLASVSELMKIASITKTFLSNTLSSTEMDVSLVKIRLFTFVARLCGPQGNPNALQVLRDNGNLDSYFDTLIEDDDPLLQISLIELLDNFSHSNEGVRLLIESGVYAQLLSWSGITLEEQGTFIGNSVHYLLSQKVFAKDKDWELVTSFLADPAVLKGPVHKGTTAPSHNLFEIVDASEVITGLSNYYASESSKLDDFYKDEETFVGTFREVSLYAVANIYCNAIKLRNFKSFYALRLATIPGLFSMIARMNASVASTTLSGEMLGGHAMLESLQSVFASSDANLSTIPPPSVHRVDDIPIQNVCLGLNVLGRLIAADGVLMALCTHHLFRSVDGFSNMSAKNVKEFLNKSLTLRRRNDSRQHGISSQEASPVWSNMDILRFLHSPIVGVSFFLAELCKLCSTGTFEVRAMALSTIANILSNVRESAEIFLFEKEFWRSESAENVGTDEIQTPAARNSMSHSDGTQITMSQPYGFLSSRPASNEDPVSPTYTNLLNTQLGKAFLENFYCLFNAIGCYSSSFLQVATPRNGVSKEKVYDTTVILGRIFTGANSLPECRHAAYEVMAATCALPGTWGLRRIFGSSELESIVSDRSAASETTAEGRRWRYSILDAALKNPAIQSLGETLLTQLRDLYERGPYSIDMEDALVEIGTQHS